MLDKETYKKELVRMWDSLRINKYKGHNNCNGVNCKKCPLHGIRCSKPINAFKMIDVVEKWAKGHPPKKFKVSRLEYDILETLLKYDLKFYQSKELYALLKKGYFKGATRDMTINYYFYNCEVVNE